MRLTLILLLMAVTLSACSSASTSQDIVTPTPRPPAPALEKQTYTVAKGEVVDEIKVSGTVAALKQQELSFAQNGFVKSVNIKRSDIITKGIVLAELDLGDLPNQLRQAEVNLTQIQIQYDLATKKRDLSRQRAQLDLDEAQANLDRLNNPQPSDVARARSTFENARANLASVIANTANAIDDQQATLNAAQRSLPLIQEAFSQALYDWDGVKDNPDHAMYDRRRADYIAAQNNLDAGTAAMNTANQNLIAAKANRQPLIDAAQANLDQAQIAYDQLTTNSDSIALASAKRAVARAQLATQEAAQTSDPELEKQLSAAKLQLENLQVAISAGQLIAPFDGIIAELSTGPGKQVEAYRSVITVINDAQTELLIQNVSSGDASRIGVGMAVDIFFARAPAIIVKGSIVKLPTRATSSSSTVNSDPAYHVDYQIPADMKVTVGDLASVVITLKRQKDVLWLPPQSVRTFEGRRFVVIKDGTRQRRQDVRIGIVSSDRVEVLEGLKEGDVIVGQ